MVEGSDLVGVVGEVTATIRGSAGPGEIRPTDGSGRDTLIAYSTSVIETGRQVLVVHYRGSASVDVVPWSSGRLTSAPFTPGDIDAIEGRSDVRIPRAGAEPGDAHLRWQAARER